MKPIRKMPKWYLPLLLLVITPAMVVTVITVFLSQMKLLPEEIPFIIVCSGITTILCVLAIDNSIRWTNT